VFALEDLYIIAGLGNPGKKYEETRHNAGFMAVDLIAQKLNIKVNKIKFKAVYGDGTHTGKRVVLLKPQTFMNLSGESIRDAVEWYKIPLSNLILIYDDIDIPAGALRIRKKGSAGSHNGMKSVIYHLQSEDFPRIRIGVGKPPEEWDLVNFVLGKFSDDEKRIMADAVERAALAALSIISDGIDKSMNVYNGK